jgi:general secretion pathway protein D
MIIIKKIFIVILVIACFYNKGFTQNINQNSEATDVSNYNLSLKSLTLKEFVDFVSEFTGKNIAYNDQDLRGNVSISSQQEMTKEAILDLFYATLRVNNLYAIDKGDYIQIIKYIDMQDYPDELTKSVSKKGQNIVTTIVTLKNVNSTNLATSFNRIKSRTGNVEDVKGINAVIIRDTENRVRKMLDIISVLEERGKGMQIHALPIMNTTASNIEAKLTRFYGELQKQGLTSLTPVVMADDYSNVVIVSATPNDFKKIEYIVSNVDVTGVSTRGAPKVYYLKNTEAEDVEEVLNKLLSEVSTEQKIVKYAVAADKSTNSIIAIGDQELYNKVETLVDRLDIPRRQVYIEGLIIETTINKADDFGVEWLTIQQSGSSLISSGFSGPNLGAYQGIVQGGSGGGSQGGAPIPGGFSLGVIGDTITYRGITFNSISALFTALATDSAINIMSKPQLLTLDNEDAEIFVGENRPFEAGSLLTEGGTAQTQMQYMDVGVSLKIKPLISSADEITLNIEAEVKRILEVAGLSATNPATLTRRTKTRVKMPDGSTMVIGGMISDDSDKSKSGIPVLKDIPLIGWLFGRRSSSSNKTNMMVFLTANIIDTREMIDNVTGERLEGNKEFKKQFDNFLK